MKGKKWILILVILVVAAGACGFYYYQRTHSPEYTIKQMVDDVHVNGVSAVEPYLSGGLKAGFERIVGIAQTPMAEWLLSLDFSTKALASVAQDAKGLDISLADVQRSANHATVVLKVAGEKLSGNINCEMIRENGKWLINDISIPATSWLYKSKEG